MTSFPRNVFSHRRREEGAPLHVHRTAAMSPAEDVVRWCATTLGVRQTWRVNLRYEPARAVITVHGDERAATTELRRIIALVRGLDPAVIDVYLPEWHPTSG